MPTRLPTPQVLQSSVPKPPHVLFLVCHVYFDALLPYPTPQLRRLRTSAAEVVLVPHTVLPTEVMSWTPTTEAPRTTRLLPIHLTSRLLSRATTAMMCSPRGRTSRQKITRQCRRRYGDPQDIKASLRHSHVCCPWCSLASGKPFNQLLPRHLWLLPSPALHHRLWV